MNVLRWLLEGLQNDGSFRKYHQVLDADQVIGSTLAACARPGCMLADVAGGDGECLKGYLDDRSAGVTITTIDIDPKFKDRPGYVIADVVSEDFMTEQYDIVFCYNAMEHFCDPIKASRNLAGLVKPGGTLILHTVFSWRYHPVPKDYFRFTDDALRYLFCEQGGLIEDACGYDLSRRRENITGGYFGDQDVPPRDWLGGFRENWGVLFVGRKPI